MFEDGPNFDTAFRLFHGQDGVVPLSNSARAEAEKKPAPVFNPLAAKAATISLSSFGPGGPFGFDAFSDMFKNQKRKSDSSKNNKDSSKVKASCSTRFFLLEPLLTCCSFREEATKL